MMLMHFRKRLVALPMMQEKQFFSSIVTNSNSCSRLTVSVYGFLRPYMFSKSSVIVTDTKFGIARLILRVMGNNW